MRTSVITIAAGRTAHLRNQMRAMRRHRPDDHIVVSMGDPDVTDLARRGGAYAVDLDAGERLPLAAARNLGARTALARGARLLVFLDVDCIPDDRLLDRYRAAAYGNALLCGPVTYLPAPPPGGYDLRSLRRRRAPHPARPAPEDRVLLDSTDTDLFWSLSFAVTAETWRGIGGFCTRYRGYGGEDTDFARKASAVGARIRWVGGADAYHQFHPVSDPPVEHLDDILVNARIYHRRWGAWPMRGWLDDFATAGLVRYDDDADQWIRTSHDTTAIASRALIETSAKRTSYA
ncbi:glycosyltransferase family 2 protein [Nocardia fluminea]